MSCLFRRSNGIWYMVYPERNRRKWLSTGTRCFGKACTIYQACPSGRDRRRPMTIADFQVEFEAYTTANYSEGTRSLYNHSLKALIRAIGDKPMRFVTVKDVERYKSCRASTVSPVSVNVEFRTLKSAFNVALKWGSVTQNPFTQSKQLRVPIMEPAYTTKKEFNALLQRVQEDGFRDVILFAVSTMMRRGEIVNLEWKDVDFERRLINVRSKENFTVKGLRPRAVPMSHMTYSLLLKRRRNEGLVFTAPDGGKLKGSSVSKKFKRYARECGLSDKIHFHSLRHTGATWLIQQGVTLYSVQRILGHTTPEMTQVYSHLSDQNLRHAIEQMDFQPNPVSLS